MSTFPILIPFVAEPAALHQVLGQLECDLAPRSTPYIVHPLRAGFPSPAADYSESALDLNQYLVAHPAASFFFDVAGDSMIGIGICTGDKVLVDRSIQAQHGHIVVAVIDGEYTLKRLYLVDGLVELHPENPRYAPMRFSDGEQLQIWGVVTGLVRKLRA